MGVLSDLLAKLIKAAAEYVDRCLPEYQPGVWNDGGAAQYCNNCYNYGCDIQTNTYAQPGYAHGITLPDPYTGNGTCSDVTAGATADGLAVTNCDQGCGCNECHHQVALVIKPNTGGTWDYHWYRKDRDGKWSHKMGWSQATNLDDGNNIITDPRTADRGKYTTFCGCFCVNKTEITIDGSYECLQPTSGTRGGAMKRSQDAILVTIGVFSGHPNPELSLKGEAAEKLSDLVKNARDKESSPPPVRPKLGEYYGFKVQTPQELSRRLSLPRFLTVFNGVISVIDEAGEAHHWRDVAKIEEFLIEQAQQHDFGPLLEQLGVVRKDE